MRKSYKRLAASLVIGLPLFVAACAESGNTSIKNATYASVDAKIHDGVTTKDQVRAMYGDPAKVAFTDSGHEEWQYIFMTGRTDARNFIPVVGDLVQRGHGHEKTLTIIFNGNVVWHHALSNSAVSSKTGVL